jgi:hypothetical protein
MTLSCCNLSLLLPHLPDHDSSLYVDLPGHRAVDNPATTVPPSFVVTSARPDIVIVDSTASHKTINLLELTVLTNTPQVMEDARCRKQSKEIELPNLSRCMTWSRKAIY